MMAQKGKARVTKPASVMMRPFHHLPGSRGRKKIVTPGLRDSKVKFAL